MPVRLLGNLEGNGEKEWATSLVNTNRYFSQFTATPGVIGEIRVNCTNTSNVKVAIYDNNAGSPNNLLAYNTGFSCVVGWNTIPLNVVVALTATDYFLAVQSETDTRVRMISSGGTQKYKTIAYSEAFGNPATVDGSTSNDVAIAGWGAPIRTVIAFARTPVT